MDQQFDVKGMSCGHCGRAVTNAVREIDPDARVEVDLGGGKVKVQSERSRAEVAGAIHQAATETVA